MRGQSNATTDLNNGGKTPADAPRRVLLFSYPKIVFLYPIFMASIVAAICMGVFAQPLDPRIGRRRPSRRSSWASSPSTWSFSLSTSRGPRR